jgi:hypothetical protein
MYTSVTLVALVGLFTAASTPQGPRWHSDYGVAKRDAQQAGKPLAVFVGTGRNGHARLSQEGRLSPPTLQFLAVNYVCLYVDTKSTAGQSLADQLAIRQDCGLVISDRSGQGQAFYHDGDLPEADLTRYLSRFADPNLVVRSTVTNPDERISNYPPETPVPAFSPALPASTFGGFRGGSC